MGLTTFFADAGVTSVSLPDGSVAAVIRGKFQADEAFAPQLLSAGFGATSNGAVTIDPVSGAASLPFGRIQLTQMLDSYDLRCDAAPEQVKSVSATGQVVAAPCLAKKIRCTSGSSVTLVLRDSVTQTQSATDTTSPQLLSLTMSAGDTFKSPVEAFFGLHATVGGTSPAFELEF